MISFGLGANLGDAAGALRTAVALIAAQWPATVSSDIYRTAPIGPDQPDYLNAVVVSDHPEVADAALAERALAVAQQAEEQLHRERSVRWGPRTLDVDVLAVGDYTSDDPSLTIPHPRIAERAFVLVPWAQVAPDLAVPGLGKVADLVTAVADQRVDWFSSMALSRRWD